MSKVGRVHSSNALRLYISEQKEGHVMSCYVMDKGELHRVPMAKARDTEGRGEGGRERQREEERDGPVSMKLVMRESDSMVK